MAGLYLLCNSQALAQSYDPNSSFQLNARVDERPQLSRQELPGIGTEPAMGHSGSTHQEGLSTLIPMPDTPQELPTSGFSLNAEQTDDNSPKAALSEYGVDWSAWISQLADLWFFNLKKLEDRSDYIFHTQQAALIRFTCYPNGQITDIVLRRSSGVPLYDRMQMEALARTRCPRFPEGTQKTSYTLTQGWESHPRRAGEQDFRPGSFDAGIALERIKKWIYFR